MLSPSAAQAEKLDPLSEPITEPDFQMNFRETAKLFQRWLTTSSNFLKNNAGIVMD